MDSGVSNVDGVGGFQGHPDFSTPNPTIFTVHTSKTELAYFILDVSNGLQ